MPTARTTSPIARSASVGRRRAYSPWRLMPPAEQTTMAALSLFSGGGGLDLGVDRAGFTHIASFDILEHAARTIRSHRPDWDVHSGEAGDVTVVDWKRFRGRVQLLHGGPPCQPFSTAGQQLGAEDPRNMWPAYVRAVLTVEPDAFIAENVPALLGRKFESYVAGSIRAPLEASYHVTTFELRAHHFGVPQVRRRLFFVGFRSKRAADAFEIPQGVYRSDGECDPTNAHRPARGARAALGLPDTGIDGLAPTIRSGLVEPHNTTSVLNSSTAQKRWEALGIWPSGVAPDQDYARSLPAPRGLHRMCVEEVGLLQGFPRSWTFSGPVYMALGQIGNAVPPPVAFAVAGAVRDSLQA